MIHRTGRFWLFEAPRDGDDPLDGQITLPGDLDPEVREDTPS
ncbi:MAG: hypothetical protein ACLP0L_26765 [Solirubrobacteraceae bacterium]